MMKKLEIAKKVIAEYIFQAMHGIFDTANIIGDEMDTIFDEDGLVIKICYYYEYFEVFGLSEADFRELKRFYHAMEGRRRYDEETA